jgi:hypothetical protein
VGGRVGCAVFALTGRAGLLWLGLFWLGLHHFLQFLVDGVMLSVAHVVFG